MCLEVHLSNVLSNGALFEVHFAVFKRFEQTAKTQLASSQTETDICRSRSAMAAPTAATGCPRRSFAATCRPGFQSRPELRTPMPVKAKTTSEIFMSGECR